MEYPNPNSAAEAGVSRRVVMNQIGTTTVVTPDVENSSVLAVTSLDPYQFRRGLKSENELYKLRRTSRGRHLVEYHRKQNELITSLLKPMETHTEEAKAEETKARLPVRIAVWSSLVANVTLSGLQLYAAITSGSLSFLATALDSVFDPASNVALYWLHKKSQRLDLRKWPVGGVRLETVGNIVYSFLMAAVNLVIIVESLQDIFSHKADDPLKAFYLPAVISVAIALGTKLALFFYCFSIRKHSSQVQVLWEDHRNDLFINGFGLLMSIGGSKWAWWLDPSGGLIIGVGTLLSWSRTIYGEFSLLIGRSAPKEFIGLVIYNASTFSEDIVGVDTVRAYHSGPDYIVEVDIVMDPVTPLSHTHDVSQQLQDKIEALPGVARAYVHVDWESEHTPEHRKHS